MSDQEHAQLIVALASARAAIDNLLVALAQEQAPDEAPARVVVESAPPEAPAECAHNNRQELGGFGVKEHWICRDCGYEFIRR